MVDSITCHAAIAYLKANLPPTEPADLIIPDREMPVARDLGNGLHVAYLIDQGDRFLYVNHRHIEQDGLSEGELHDLAVANLKQRADAIGLTLHPLGKSIVLNFDNNFDASLLLIDSLWDDQLAKRAPNGFIAAIPSRGLLAFADAGSQEGVEELRRLIQLPESTADHPISDILYCRIGRARAWQPYVN